MFAFMLDTDTVSYALRGVGGVKDQISRRKPLELCVSAITMSELWYGAAVRGSRKLDALIAGFAANVTVLAFDERAAATFGHVAAGLAQRGTPIGQLDTLIAAHALSLGLIFVTNNAKHFRRVRGLRTENWI